MLRFHGMGSEAGPLQTQTIMETRFPLRWPLCLGAGLVLLLGATLATSAQEEAPSPLPGVFSEVLDVRVVNLEVVVTDKDGIPVRGLGPDAFRLTIDGEEVPIDYFSEVRAGVTAPPAPGQEELGVAELPALVPGEPVETSYLVFIDEFFAIARDRDKVIRSLISDLPRMGPNDRMAIVAHNGKDLEMLSTWSQSVPALERTLEGALERPVYGLRRLAEQRQYDFERLLRASFDIRNGVIDDQRFLRTDLLPDERFFLERLTEQIQQSVTAAALTMRSFAMPPGRKVMLLYSGGWPFFPVTFLGPNISPIVQPTEQDRGVALFRPLTDTANLLGYTIYAADMPGFNDLLAEGPGRVTAETLREPNDSGFESFRREQEMHLTLDFLAEETGGKAFLNEGRLTAFADLVSDTRSYYWLGFSPQRGWDDARHKVDVTMAMPGFKVRARQDYRDSSKQHEVAMALESSLLFGSPSGTDELLVELGEPKKAGRKRVDIPVALFVPLDKVTFLPDGNRRVAQLDLQIALRDEEGRRAPIPVVQVFFQTESELQAGAYGRFDTKLRMRKVDHSAVFGIHDPASGRILTKSVEIKP